MSLPSSDLAGYTKLWLSQYDSIRGKKYSDFAFPFWDAVAITTADNNQREAYQLQLTEKQSRGELPVGVAYHVIADPVGPKLGNGGSTLTALSSLEETYGEGLFGMRILLIHAGGQSQRMPSASVLGKIFTALPFGDPMYQMLDLKLAVSVPFLQNMKPGVLLMCADDIEIFTVSGAEDRLRMDKPGFTAVAHPSNLDMGTGHGVYVIEGGELFTDVLVQTSECLQVLQKPSLETMQNHGAHLKLVHSDSPERNQDGAVGSGDREPIVYTDSFFYFDADISRKLVKFHHENRPLTCEIDAYGDFLQCLGPQSSIDYATSIRNVSQPNADLIPTRKKIYHLLKDSPIHVLGLNKSRFVHLGTTKELLYHFCEDSELHDELSITRNVFSAWQDRELNAGDGKRRRLEPCLQGCVLHTMLPSASSVPDRAIVEYCWFDVPVNVGRNSIISNCQLLSEHSNLPCVDLSADLFLHTVAVFLKDNSTGYVTVVFDIMENLKKKASSSEEMGNLPYMKKTVAAACAKFNLDLPKVVPAQNVNSNIWRTRLFPVSPSMTESFCLALKMVKALECDDPKLVDLSSHTLVSMDDILQLKDVKSMLAYRSELRSAIKAARK